MSVNDLIQRAISEINFEGLIIEQTKQALEKAVKEVVSDQFRPYSKFREALGKHIASEMGVDFSRIKLPQYRDFIVSAINDKLAKFCSQDRAKEIADFIDEEIVGESRETIPFDLFFSELCEKVLDGAYAAEPEVYEVSVTKEDRSWSSFSYFRLTVTVGRGTRSEEKLVDASFGDNKIYYVRRGDSMSRVGNWLQALKYRGTAIEGVKERSEQISKEEE